MTAIKELIVELENIKLTKCKTLQEMVFFDGVLAIIEGKYLEKEKESSKELVEALESCMYGLKIADKDNPNEGFKNSINRAEKALEKQHIN